MLSLEITPHTDAQSKVDIPRGITYLLITPANLNMPTHTSWNFLLRKEKNTEIQHIPKTKCPKTKTQPQSTQTHCQHPGYNGENPPPKKLIMGIGVPFFLS